MNCKEFSKHIGDYVNRKLDEEVARSAEIHLSTCARCASLVKELEKTSLLVSSLERASAPVGFEEHLKNRLASPERVEKRHSIREWLRTLGEVFLGTPGHRFALRPVLAGLLLCAVIIGSVFIIGRDRNSDTLTIDWTYIETCQAQHASFAAANPLADESAVILKERVRELDNDL